MYGKAVHKIAECFVQARGQRTIGEVAYDVLSGKISLERDETGDVKCPRLPEEYKKRLPEHIRSIQKLTEQIGTDGDLEKAFEFDLDPPNNRKVKGFIDRVIRRGDNFFLLDYKTSKKNNFRKNTSTISKDLQLRTYARVIQREYNVPAKNIKTSLYYLEGANLIGCTFSEESLARVESELLNVYKDIESTPETQARASVGPSCYRCDYRKICPYFRVI